VLGIGRRVIAQFVSQQGGGSVADVIDLILKDHTWFREQFAELDRLRAVDEPDLEAIGAVWSGLATKLDLHADAEEEIFYPQVLRLGQDDPQEETLDAIGDHKDIRDGVAAAAQKKVGTDAWWDAVTQAREANDEHMGEEEHEGLADMRLHASAALIEELGRAWISYFAEQDGTTIDGVDTSDKDPEQYVAEHSTEPS
jgi:hypothetical protein